VLLVAIVSWKLVHVLAHFFVHVMALCQIKRTVNGADYLTCYIPTLQETCHDSWSQAKLEAGNSQLRSLNSNKCIMAFRK
jgi:hypothetical protein